MSFTSKVVVITGGNSGIGAASALEFAKKGAHVVITGRNEDKLAHVVEKCSQIGKPPLAIKADLEKDKDIKTIIDRTIDKYGRIDVLINNAGIFKDTPITSEESIKIYDQVMNVNLRSLVVLTTYALPWLIKSKGNIVNLSSVAGVTEVKSHYAYSVSKAGIIQYTKVAAADLAPHGVRVNVVSPGPCKTELFSAGNSSFTWDALTAFCAMKKLLVPEEVAELIVYLASDAARSVTGANYVIDNGFLLAK